MGIDRGIQDNDCAILKEVLKSNTSLTKIEMNKNQIGDRGVKFIAAGLKENTTLKYLNLMENVISDEGAKSVSEVLKFNTIIEDLDLENNKVSQKVLTSLLLRLPEMQKRKEKEMKKKMKAFCSTHSLSTNDRTWNLYNRQLQDMDCVTIGNILKTNATLTSLGLGDNQIADEGAKAIGEGLKKKYFT